VIVLEMGADQMRLPGPPFYFTLASLLSTTLTHTKALGRGCVCLWAANEQITVKEIDPEERDKETSARI